MTQLGDTAIGTLVVPVTTAFAERDDDFWSACRKQAPGIRNEVADGPFRREVEDALVFLDANSQAAPLLGDLLLARPADAPLRLAIGQAHPDALAAVSELRFQVESQIGAALSSGEAARLRGSLDEIDDLMGAVTAYKAMHDALHVLQPLLPLMRGAAANRSRWPELRIYPVQFRQQLNTIGKAAADLTALGRSQQLSFRVDVTDALDMLEAAIGSREEYEVRDYASQIGAAVERGLDTVDVLMLAAAEEANAPFHLALQFLEPLAGTAAGTSFEALIASYIDFARHISSELSEAIREHGRWQQLDRQFELLQRTVVENQPGAPGEIDTVWRLAGKQLDAMCCGEPVPEWATAIVRLLGSTREVLVPPIAPPIDDEARDRMSALISNGRSRFMAVDQALLDWLARSVGKRPELVSLLRGEERVDA